MLMCCRVLRCYVEEKNMLQESQNIIINMPRDWFDYLSVIVLPLVVIGVSILQWRISKRQKDISFFELKHSYIKKLSLLHDVIEAYIMLLEGFTQNEIKNGEDVSNYVGNLPKRFLVQKYNLDEIILNLSHVDTEITEIRNSIALLFKKESCLEMSLFADSWIDKISKMKRPESPVKVYKELEKQTEELFYIISLLEEEIRLNNYDDLEDA